MQISLTCAKLRRRCDRHHGTVAADTAILVPAPPNDVDAHQIGPTASAESELEAAFVTMVQHRVGGLVVMPDPLFISRREQVVELAAHHTMPAIYPLRVFADIGGLISYGSNVGDLFQQTGVYVGKILKGAKPADLPIQQSTKVELVINLKTAKALGLTVPPSLLARADEVIE